MHDVGKHDDSTSSQSTEVAARIPAWVYTAADSHVHGSSQQWNNYRPDTMLVTGGQQKPVHRR